MNSSKEHVVFKLHWKDKKKEESWRARHGESQFISRKDRNRVSVDKLMDTALFDSIEVIAHYTTGELLDSIRDNKVYIGTVKKTI